MIKNLLKKIKDSNSVLGIISMGSTASAMNKHSDIDLAIIIDNDAPELFSSIGFHENHILDLYFFKKCQLENILRNDKKINGYSMNGKLIKWVHTEKIECDKTRILEKIKVNKSTDDLEYLTKKDKYNTWFNINFNFYHNQRYFKSNNDKYLRSLEIRLLYSLMDLLTGYMKLRNIEWTGEKDAIEYLDNHNKTYLDEYFSCIREDDINKKFFIYQKLVNTTINQYKNLSDKNEFSILFNGDSINFKKAEIFVKNLIK